MIRARHEAPEIGWGDYFVIPTRDPGVLALRYDWRGNSVLAVHNLHDAPREVRFKVGTPEGDRLIDILDGGNSQAEPDGRHRLVLEPYGYRWFRVGGLDYILKREER